MRPPMLRIHDDEMIIDLFAGGGGWSVAIEMALGRSPDVAVNHDPDAIAMHKANHPSTEHYIEDIYDVDPRVVAKGRNVGLLVLSPDCTDHSHAKNGAIVRNKKVRCLANVAHRWAAEARPRIIILENVVEWLLWGPLTEEGHVDKDHKGEFFDLWWRRLEDMGYRLSKKLLTACDHGAPTSRKRVFVVASCDPDIDPNEVWPTPTHGPGRPEPYKTAAECIDYSIPCPSIFMTRRQARKFTKATGIRCKRPLADNTLRRIRRGIFKYVIANARPFLVPVTHQDDERVYDIADPMRTVTGANRGEIGFIAPIVSPAKTWGGGGNEAAPADKPLRTITTSKRGEYAVVAPYITRVAHADVGKNGSRRRGAGEHAATSPLPTVTCSKDFAVVAPVLSAYYGESNGGGNDRERPLDHPLPTQTTANRFGMIAPTLVQTGYGERPGQAPRCLDLHAPLGTIIAGGGGSGNGKHALVTAFLELGYSERDTGGWNGGRAIDRPVGAVTCKDHHHLVTGHMVKLRGTSDEHVNASSMPYKTPVPTISANGNHVGEVRAFLTKYYGTGESKSLFEPLDTVTTKDRFGLVVIDGQEYQIVDIGFRMLEPRELFRAQGFPESYIIDPIVPKRDKLGRVKRNKAGEVIMGPLSKTGQVEKVGNSVSPPLAAALLRSVFAVSAARQAA